MQQAPFDGQPSHWPILRPRLMSRSHSKWNASREITRNLVENAIGHAPAGSEVAIALDRSGTLSIVDHGPGIPETHRVHLFERFWRGPWTSRPGSGLGLAIVAEACQRVGATVQCVSTLGGGATFQVRLATAS